MTETGSPEEALRRRVRRCLLSGLILALGFILTGWLTSRVLSGRQGMDIPPWLDRSFGLMQDPGCAWEFCSWDPVWAWQYLDRRWREMSPGTYPPSLSERVRLWWAIQGHGYALVNLGLTLLILTPLWRLGASIPILMRGRDRRLAAVSGATLLLLAASIAYQLMHGQ